ncbi:MAG: pilus assembly protein, partial [Chloroflexaceae bacterium]|nr:pilus assembly protein [Chloroflexaceae bacterium]
MTVIQRIRSAGQALVEFTFAAVLIFFLLAAAIDLGMIFFTMQSLHSAAQEGALFGSMMFYDDVNDEDGDGILKRDPYYNPSIVGGVPVSQTDALEHDPPLWYFYEGYYQGIRERTVYEAGHEGGSGFSNLHDLNHDGRRDTWEEIRDNGWVNISIFRHLPGGGTEPCGDPYVDNECKIRVTVRSRYQLFFPLAPAFTDEIWLQSSYVVEMNESGFAKAPSTDPGVYVPLETETPTPTETPEPATPTPTPNPYCVTAFEGRGVVPAAVEEPWESAFVPEGVQGDGDTDGATEEGASKVELCSSGLGIQPAASTDDFYYVYAQREGSAAKFVSFSARVTNWALDGSANDGTSAGLMIRKDREPHHPYAMVAYVPSRNQVVFQIRADESVAAVPAWADLPLNFQPSESTPLWLRLERTNSLIAASYKTTGEWQYIKHGATNWVDVDLYQSYALFGMSQSSGTDTLFALSTFQDIQIVPNAGPQLEVVFIEPEDGTELVSFESDTTTEATRHTNFEIELRPETTDTFQVEKVVYTLVSPDGATDLDGMPHTWTREGGTMSCNQNGCNPSFMLCPFGGEAGNCDPMPESTYESLQARGANNNYYTIRAEVYVKDEPDPRVFGGQSRFFINRPQIEFYNPPNDEYVWQAGDAGDVGVHAWDRKNGRMVDDGGWRGTNGIGLTAMEYAMVFYPTLPEGYIEEARGSLCDSQPRYCQQRLYETDYDRMLENGYSLDDLVCMFGSHADGSCREMSAEDGALPDPAGRLPEYEELRAGEYFLAARALSTLPDGMKPGEAGFDESLWTEWAWRQRIVVPPIEFRFSHAGGSWEAEEVPVVNRDNTNALKVEVNAPHVGPDNGDGLDFIRVELYKRNGAQIVPVTSLNLSPQVDVQALDPVPDFFCIFAGSTEGGADCPNAEKEPFYNLEGGRYILRVLATNKASDLHAWVEDERELQIDTAPIARRFVDRNNNFLTEDGSRSVKGEEDTVVRLVAHIDEADEGIDLDKNGEGVYQVEFQLFEEETNIPFPAGQGATTYVLSTEDVSSSPFYCPFGFDGSDCRPISYGDDGDFHSLKSKTRYTLWAVPKRQIEGELQSGNPLGFTFVIPEMQAKFKDGAPAFNEAVKELEETRFELEAHDPRYGSTENGAGIAAFGFEMCRAGGSCIEKTYGIAMVDGNLRFVEDADPNEEAYTATYDDGYGGSRPSLCLFGQEDGSTDCQTMAPEAFREPAQRQLHHQCVGAELGRRGSPGHRLE